MKKKNTNNISSSRTVVSLTPPVSHATCISGYSAQDLEVILHANACMARSAEQEGCNKEDLLELRARGTALRAQLESITGARVPSIAHGLSSSDEELAEFLESLGCVADAELFQGSANSVSAGCAGGEQR